MTDAGPVAVSTQITRTHKSPDAQVTAHASHRTHKWTPPVTTGWPGWVVTRSEGGWATRCRPGTRRGRHARGPDGRRARPRGAGHERGSPGGRWHARAG